MPIWPALRQMLDTPAKGNRAQFGAAGMFETGDLDSPAD